MTSPLLFHELPYRADTTARFEPFADSPWSMWLDSAGLASAQSRYDIVVADPLVTLITRGDMTTITERNGHSARSSEDPLSLLRVELGRYSACAHPDIPFMGGAVGYFAYDLARRLQPLPTRAANDIDLPEMAIGIYEWAYVADHHQQRSWLAGIDSTDLALRWQALCRQFTATTPARQRPPISLRTTLQSNLDEAAYGEAFARIQYYLREGECYQVNLARRFSTTVAGDPFAGYCALRKRNSAPFSAYLNLPFAQVLSSSPESFLSVVNRQVKTRPIKGTRPRGGSPAEDQALAEELRQSRKDRAENVMIVDLLRNDLGKSCDTGSVRVPELFAVESYATVHHLVSTVTAELAPDKDAIDLLRGAFPGGSITGAPKIRAMEIIEELEPHRRTVYCGAIGYIGFDGNMETSIAIRTLLHCGGEIHFWAGGGIVIDSEVRNEFQETLHKAAGMARIFEGGEG